MTTFTSDDRIAVQKELDDELNKLCCGKCDGCSKELPKEKSLEQLAEEFEDSYYEKIDLVNVRWAID